MRRGVAKGFRGIGSLTTVSRMGNAGRGWAASEASGESGLRRSGWSYLAKSKLKVILLEKEELEARRRKTGEVQAHGGGYTCAVVTPS
jgi:hypothetical protein